MKLPSLVKIPRYKRFDYAPRYYDPVKEDIDNRTALIRSELNQQKNRNVEGESAIIQSRIQGAFRRKSDQQQSKQSFILQAIIAGMLTLLFVFLFAF